MQPTSRQADSPAGFVTNLTFPYDDDPNGLGQAALKKAVVQLPNGVSVSPASANGLGACAPSDIGIDNDAEPNCPNSSKIGTVSITTPLLDDPLTGSIYLAQPTSTQLIRIYVVARGSGVLVKLPGVIDGSSDKLTEGQLTATFDNNPQLPFTDLELRFKDGPSAPLVTPDTCGTYTTKSTLTAWSGKVVESSDSFDISVDGRGTPCGAPGFDPSLIAGTVNAAGGSDSPFTLTFARGDRQQDLSTIDVNLPRGLLARLALADLCTEAVANAGACGAGSQIGTVTVAAGAGPLPLWLRGRVFITEGRPGSGAPFGLSILVPAVAGPFDLGNVVVRASLFVDRSTTAVRIVSDPMPTVLQGIPLQVRKVNVAVDRPGFMFNPTDCTASTIAARIGSAIGTVVGRSVRFQSTNCARLPFAPKMTFRVGARGKLTRGKRTPLTVKIAMTRGQANNRSVEVTLPKSLNARLDVVNRRVACSIEQFTADRCPQVVGNATAVTPLLRSSLSGPAYFVYNPARRLPDLVVRLKGQVNVDLVGKVTITRDLKLQTTFDLVPDVPISAFTLRLESGPRNGPIGLTRNVCLAATRKTLNAELDLRAQNNKRIVREQAISVDGCARASNNRARRSTKKKK